MILFVVGLRKLGSENDDNAYYLIMLFPNTLLNYFANAFTVYLQTDICKGTQVKRKKSMLSASSQELFISLPSAAVVVPSLLLLISESK